MAASKKASTRIKDLLARGEHKVVRGVFDKAEAPVEPAVCNWTPDHDDCSIEPCQLDAGHQGDCRNALMNVVMVTVTY